MKRMLQPHEKRFLKTVLIALLILLLPLIYTQPEYEKLKEDEIQIAWSYYSSGRHSVGSFVGTPEGTTYKIGGHISSKAEFEALLVPGTTVHIKYYRGVCVVAPMKFIEELTVSRKTIVTFNNQQKLVQTLCIIVGSVILVAGFLHYADCSHLLKKLRKWRKKRNA